MVNAPERGVESSYFEEGEEISIVCLPKTLLKTFAKLSIS